jgi:predicted ATP-grasp superfamily ATP-dependent carboligase
MPTIAVAALSARMLAELARQDGYEVIALDRFGDADTRRASARWMPVGAEGAMAVDGERLRDALSAVAGDAGLVGWIAGSGLDDAAVLSHADAAGVALIGNAPGVVARVRDARRFFATLESLGIGHPETRFEGPTEAPGWLVKDERGTGGWHVRRARAHEPLAAHRYWQREAQGTPMSATFVAADGDAFVLGCNRLIVRPFGALPFVYRGAIGPVPLPPAAGAEVSRAVKSLAGAFGLRGLGSLDFILEGDRILVHELNPRPSATTGLYAQRLSPGPVRAHVDACAGGVLPSSVDRSLPIEGNEVVFARRPLHLGDAAVKAIESSGGCHDIPAVGAALDAGDPVCSVTAVGDDPERIRVELKARRDALLDQLETTT